MKIRNAIFALVSAMSLISMNVFAGGSTEQSASQGATQPAASEQVTLKMIMVGSKAKDTDQVLEKLNEMLLKATNTKIELEYLGWSDWQTKYQLLFAGGDEFDAIFAADWALYGQMAVKNAFLEITEDMIKKYAPNLAAKTPKTAWDQVKINNKIYMIPQLRNEFNQRHWIIRADLRKKYGLPPIKSVSDIEKYLETIKQNEPGLTGILAQPSNSSFFIDVIVNQPNEWASAGNITGFEYLKYSITDAKSSKLINLFDTPEYLGYLKLMRSWNEKGYIGKNILSNSTGGQQLFENGQTSLFVQNLGTANKIFNNIKKSQSNMEVEFVDGTYGKRVLPYPSSAGGLAINSRSKNAARVLMVTDFLRYNEAANYLAQRGIEGVHWTVAPGQTDKNIVVMSPGYGDSFTWGPWRVDIYQEQPAPADAVPGYHAVFNDLKKRVVNHPLQQFNFDSTNVKNELAAVKAVAEQYLYPLEWGFVDPVEGLATLKEKLRQAGYDKIVAEVQKQANDYMANIK